MAVKKEELIREYSRAIWEGNAAVFGGAGLSRASGYADWKELLRPIASDIGLDIDKENDLLAVAQFYKNKRGGTRSGINQALMGAFTKEVKTNENVKILTRLPIFTYWTTNYDNLIETGIREANRNPDVKSEPEQLSVLLPERDAVVYKMHGDISNPAHAVLTKTDYELYEHRRPLFRTALKGDLVSKVFLFIGFSFEDPNLNDILGQIHSLLNEDVHDHYCFFKKVQKENYENDEDYGYHLAKQEMQSENLQQYGIQTVFVDSYDEITEILRYIEAASKMRNIFISGSAAEYSYGWNKNTAEELAGKLAAALVKNNYRITSGFGLGIGSAVINGALDIIYNDKYRHIDEYLCLRPFPQNISDASIRGERWKEYREDIIGNAGIVIFMFGNKIIGTNSETRKIAEADGCLQEFEIAKALGKVIIPIGSTGYAARTILEEVKKNILKYPYLAGVIEQLENEKDINKIISLVLEIVKKQIV